MKGPEPGPPTATPVGFDSALHHLLARAPRHCTLVVRADAGRWADVLRVMQQATRDHPDARKLLAWPDQAPAAAVPTGFEVLSHAPEDDESLIGRLLADDDAGDAVILLPTAPSPPAAQPSDLWRRLFDIGWRLRGVAAWAVPAGLRTRLRDGLARRAWNPGERGAAGPAWTVAKGAAEGVALVGALSALSGVGEAARATRRALESAGVAFRAWDSDAATGRVAGRAPEAVDRCPPLISLLHLNADRLAQARVQLGEAAFRAPHRIGCWAWELERFPVEQHAGFAHVDEVWVPSRFCQQAIAAVARVPVLCMPHALELPGPARPDRTRFGLAPGATVFLAMADGLSSLARKNPLGALQAYAAAFQRWPEPVQLLVKLSHGHRDPDLRRAVLGLAARTPGVIVLEELLDRQSVGRLLDSVDVFVSLHRSEGFGLVIAESMARGKVALATGWSGNMDFMTAANSVPLSWRLTTLQRDQGPYRRGQRWAEPDFDDAVQAMRRLASDPGLRAGLGAQARSDMAEQLAPARIGQRMAGRLREITQALQAPGVDSVDRKAAR